MKLRAKKLFCFDKHGQHHFMRFPVNISAFNVFNDFKTKRYYIQVALDDKVNPNNLPICF